MLIYRKADLSHPRISHSHSLGRSIRYLRFTDDDSHILARSASGLLRVYEITTGKLVLRARDPVLRRADLLRTRVVKSKPEWVFELFFRDTTSMMFKRVPKNFSAKYQFDVGEIFFDSSWSRDAQDMLIASSAMLHHFDLISRKKVASIATPFPGSRFVKVAFQPNGVIAVAKGKKIFILDGRDPNHASTGGRIIMRGLSTPGKIMGLTFDALGERLIAIYRATAGNDKSAIRGSIWQAGGFRE